MNISFEPARKIHPHPPNSTSEYITNISYFWTRFQKIFVKKFLSLIYFIFFLQSLPKFIADTFREFLLSIFGWYRNKFFRETKFKLKISCFLGNCWKIHIHAPFHNSYKIFARGHPWLFKNFMAGIFFMKIRISRQKMENCKED